MAQWIKTPLNQYVQINQIISLYVGIDPDVPSGGAIYAQTPTGSILVRAGFASPAAAQTFLDNAITANLGGSV